MAAVFSGRSAARSEADGPRLGQPGHRRGGARPRALWTSRSLRSSAGIVCDLDLEATQVYGEETQHFDTVSIGRADGPDGAGLGPSSSACSSSCPAPAEATQLKETLDYDGPGLVLDHRAGVVVCDASQESMPATQLYPNNEMAAASKDGGLVRSHTRNAAAGSASAPLLAGGQSEGWVICPVCGEQHPPSSINAHVNRHFDDEAPTTAADVACGGGRLCDSHPATQFYPDQGPLVVLDSPSPTQRGRTAALSVPGDATSTHSELMQQGGSYPATQLYLDDVSPGVEADGVQTDQLGACLSEICAATQLYSDDALLTSDGASAPEQVPGHGGGAVETHGAGLSECCPATQLYMEDVVMLGEGGSAPSRGTRTDAVPAGACSSSSSDPCVATQFYSEGAMLADSEIAVGSEGDQGLLTSGAPAARCGVSFLDECAATQLYMEDAVVAHEGTSALNDKTFAAGDPSQLARTSLSGDCPATQFYAEDPILFGNASPAAASCASTKGCRVVRPDHALKPSSHLSELGLCVDGKSLQSEAISNAPVEHAVPEPVAACVDAAGSSECAATQLYSDATILAHGSCFASDSQTKDEQPVHHQPALRDHSAPPIVATSMDVICAATQLYPEADLLPSASEVQGQSCMSRGEERPVNVKSSVSFLDSLPATQLYFDEPILSADGCASIPEHVPAGRHGPTPEVASSSQQRTSAWHQHLAPPAAEICMSNSCGETQHYPEHGLTSSAAEMSHVGCGAAGSDSLLATQLYLDEPILGAAASPLEGNQCQSERPACSSPQRTLASHQHSAPSDSHSFAEPDRWSKPTSSDSYSKDLRLQPLDGGSTVESVAAAAAADPFAATQIYPDELDFAERGKSSLPHSASLHTALWRNSGDVASSTQDFAAAGSSHKRPAPPAWEPSADLARSKTPRLDEPLSESLAEWCTPSSARAGSADLFDLPMTQLYAETLAEPSVGVPAARETMAFRLAAPRSASPPRDLEATASAAVSATAAAAAAADVPWSRGGDVPEEDQISNASTISNADAADIAEASCFDRSRWI